MSRVADCSQCPAIRGREKGRRPAAAAAEGHVPLHVGEEMERFEVRTELLARPAFLELLRRSAQEYGYGQRGVLRIPCPVPFFRRLLAACGDRVEEEEELLRSFDELFHSSSDPN
ncbi:SAUR family [Musa troglodytarum]|uniref:SAUR family n=1 Tax=Musa troglodytarum TaxID=320322 RepID=A0A9E7FIN0_9LILI|nr:SAUR family [Musa troglodytarum]